MIAAYAMRGRVQAIQMALLFFLLATLMAPLAILGAAVVGLVALRQGGRSALEVGLVASLLTAVAFWLMLGDWSPGLTSLLVWLPVLLLTLVLRYSISLGLTVQVAMFIGLAPLLLEAIYLPTGGGLTEMLAPLRQALTQAAIMEDAQVAEVMDWLSRWFVAIMAGGLFIQTCVGLFFARGWQAKLYNAGGFAKEFRELRFSRAMTYTATLVLVLILSLDGAQWSWLRVLAVLLSMLFFLQGLAVLHALLARNPAGQTWLVGVYALLFLAMPYMGMVLAATGYMDSWWNFRPDPDAAHTDDDKTDRD
jgi:hypothetical protein